MQTQRSGTDGLTLRHPTHIYITSLIFSFAQSFVLRCEMKYCQLQVSFFWKCNPHIEQIVRSSPIVQCNDEDTETYIFKVKLLSLCLT